MVDGPPLSRSHYDRAANRRSDDEWLASAWARAQVLFVTPKSATVVDTSDASPRVALRASSQAPADAPRRFLGLVADEPVFAVTVDDGDGEWQTLREIGPALDDLQAGLLVSAIALQQWHQRHTHCPLCGTPTVEAQAGWIRRCPNDGSDHFPRTDPAVIMLVEDGAGRALLGRGQDWGEGRFSTLAGFVEPGESLEAAVAREVFEETGVRVTDVRYVASQPWPFPSSLMLGFTARLDGDPTIRLDPVEMAEAHWFTRDEIQQAREWTDTRAAPDPAARARGISPRFSISRYLIDGWLDGLL